MAFEAMRVGSDMASPNAEEPRNLFCRVGETEWADSLIYWTHGKAEPSVVVGTRLNLQLAMEPRKYLTTSSQARSFRLIEPTAPAYEVAGLIREVASKEFGHHTKHIVGYALMDSARPLVLVIGGRTADAVQALTGKWVKAMGILRATLSEAFWSAPVSSWVWAEVRAIRDGRWDSKVLEVTVP